ncbi:MAG: PEGA domain-containing protein [Myxococcota bacterium]
MKRTTIADPRTYAAAVTAARAAAEDDLDESVARVEQRLVAELARQHVLGAAPRRLAWTLGLGAALLATASVALVLWLAPQTPLREAPQFVGSARIILRTGGVGLSSAASHSPIALDSIALAGGTHIHIETGARLDVALGDAAQMALWGPAAGRLTAAGIPEVIAGTAAFAITPRPPGSPFVVRAGDTEVVVHGTRFALAVDNGRLARLDVSEGTVELRPVAKQDASGRMVCAGQSYALRDTAAALTVPRGVFAEPWWTLSSDLSATGYFAIDSRPQGAEARVNGVALGQTPLLVQWSRGEQHVQLDSPGFAPWSAVVTMAGERKRIAPQLTPLVEPSPHASAAPQTRDAWGHARSLVAQRQCTALADEINKVLAQSTSDDERARAYALGGECSLRTGERAAALAAFQQIVAEFGATATAELALFESATLEDELGQPEHALVTLERYLERYPSGELAAAATYRRCDVLLRLQRRPQATACLQTYLTRFPEAPRAADAVLLLATSAFAAEQWATAAELYRDYLVRAPDTKRSEDALYHLVICLDRGKLDGLSAAVEQYLVRWPSGAHADRVQRARP